MVDNDTAAALLGLPFSWATYGVLHKLGISVPFDIHPGVYLLFFVLCLCRCTCIQFLRVTKILKRPGETIIVDDE